MWLQKFAVILIPSLFWTHFPVVDPKTRHHFQRVRELVQKAPEHKQGQVLQRIWLQAFHRLPSADVLHIQGQALNKIEQILYTNLTTNIDRLFPAFTRL